MTTYEQQQIVDEILDLMQRSGAIKAPLNTGQADEGVEKTLDDLLEMYRESGVFLTNVMKIPSRPQMVMLEAINGVGEYRYNDRRIEIRLKNVSSSPVKIGAGVRHYRVKNANGTPTDLQYGERIHRVIEPGQEISLPPSRACGVLARYCREAFDPLGQRRWPHEHDSIREIGYSYREQGSGDIITCPAKKSKK